MVIFPYFLVLVGIGLLYWGGETLVTGSIALARHFGLSSMVIGLTVVAFATSAPELAAAMTANLLGSLDIATGNAVGSNIANIGLILGASALFFALPATGRFVRRELAFMVVVTILMYPIMLRGLEINRIEGAVLVGVLVFFVYSLVKSPSSQHVYEIEEGVEEIPLWRSTLSVGFGVALLVGGANALVHGATEIALAFGVPERVIGLTLVALGTSLPELAASLAAGRKGEADLVMGNIVGSNIFNLLCILGLTAAVSPIAVAPQVVGIDFWVMLGFSLLLMIFLYTRGRLRRLEGAVLLALYVGYSVFLYVYDAPVPAV